MCNNSSSGAIEPFSFRGAKEERRECLSLVVSAIRRHLCQTLKIAVNFHLRNHKELWKLPGAIYENL